MTPKGVEDISDITGGNAMPDKPEPSDNTIISSGGHYLGWRRDTPDFRDEIVQPRQFMTPMEIPAQIDLRSTHPGMPGVYDQGAAGSCTGNAIAGAIEYRIRQQANQKEFVPSRLYIYYNERSIENTVNSDAGAAIRDGIQSVVQWGVCSESPQSDMSTVWPYNLNNLYTQPPTACYTAARKDLVRSYARVPQTTEAMCAVLAAGHPIVFGFTVYSSFESQQVASTGMVPLPSGNDALEGGHAVMLVGYNNATQMFTVRNSWGSKWGDHGYCYMPYAYVEDPNLAADFWHIDVVGT